MFAPGSCGCVCVCVRQADTDSDAGALRCPHQRAKPHAGHVVWRRDRCTCGAGDGSHLPSSVLATGSACVLTSPLNLPATTPQHPISSIPNPPSRPSSPRVSPWPSTSYVDPPTLYPLGTNPLPYLPSQHHTCTHYPPPSPSTIPSPLLLTQHPPPSHHLLPSFPLLPFFPCSPPSLRGTHVPPTRHLRGGWPRSPCGRPAWRARSRASIDRCDGWG